MGRGASFRVAACCRPKPPVVWRKQDRRPQPPPHVTMARSSSEDTVTESILLSDSFDRDNGSRGSSRPRSDGYTDEDEYYYDHPRTYPRRPSSSFNRVLEFVGINGRRRRHDYDLRPSASGEALRGLLARPSGRRRPPRETRTCRKGFAVSTVRRLLIVTPFVILMLL